MLQTTILNNNNTDAMASFTCPFTKIHRQRTSTWQKATIIFLVMLIIPIACVKSHNQGLNRTNSIDKRKSSDFSYDDPTTEDYTVAPQIISCGACRMREEIKSRSLEAIKGDVLRKLGFQTAPNVTGRTLPHVPPHILAMVDQGYAGMQSDEPQFKTGPSISEEDDDYHIKTQKVVSFAQPYPRLRHSWRGHDIIYFQLSESISKYRVTNATLRIFVKGVDRRPLPSFHIEVFKVYRDPNHPDTPGMVKMSSKRLTQPLGHGEFVDVDITVMVSEWCKSARENFGFIVNGTVNGRKVVVTDNTIDGGSKTPLVEIMTAEPKRRTRRNLGLNCDDKMNESLCCRYPLTVDFEEFGWDFIIAPKRYEAHYCSGECPYVTMQRHPHTHLLKMASPNSAGPCCAPRKMSAISMLYFDQQFNVIYGSLPGMVVDRCGCS